jgi:predicted DNA-binding transcriptional regulator YafY
MNITCDKITNEYYIENIDDYEGNNFTRWLLNSFSINNIIRESTDIRERILLESTPSAEIYLTELISAMRENLIVKMVYHPFWKEETFEMELNPYFVKLFKKRWYVFGTAENKAKLKVYALDRIEKLTVTNKQFFLPTDFSPVEHLYNSIGIMKTDSDKPCEIMIKSYGNSSKYLRALPLHHSQVEVDIQEAYSLFKLYLAPTDDFYQEILSKREYIEVISPQIVREKLASIIHKLSEYYL